MLLYYLTAYLQPTYLPTCYLVVPAPPPPPQAAAPQLLLLLAENIRGIATQLLSISRFRSTTSHQHTHHITTTHDRTPSTTGLIINDSHQVLGYIFNHVVASQCCTFHIHYLPPNGHSDFLACSFTPTYISKIDMCGCLY